MPDPAIQDSVFETQRRERRDAVISVKNVVLAVMEHERARNRDTSGFVGELAALDEALTAIEGQTLAEYILNPVKMPFDEEAHRLLRIWREADTPEGQLNPLPPQLCDRFKAMISKIP